MQTSLVEETRTRLLKFHGRYPEIGRMASLSYSWLTKFAQGRALNPTMRNLEPLQRALDTLERAAQEPTDPAPPVRRTPAAQGATAETTEAVLTTGHSATTSMH
jgi:hypothetical protein